MNNKGRISGILLVIILIVALLIAFLAMKQMDKICFGSVSDHTQQENPVERAQDAVDAINDRKQQQYNSIDLT